MVARVPGQQVLESMPEVCDPTSQLDQQLSLMRVLTPEYQGLNPEDYTEIGERERRAAAPDHLRTGLIDVPRNSRLAVAYDTFDEAQQVNRQTVIAISAAESDLVIRALYPGTYAQRAFNRAMKRAPIFKSEAEARQHANQEATQAVQSKQVKMADYIEATLKPENTRLDRFTEYARNREKRRLKGVNFDVELTWIRENVFGGMLTVIGVQREWTAEQRRLASLAVDWRIFFDNGDNRRIGNFFDMTKLAREYYGLKLGLFADREYRAGKYVEQHSHDLG